MPVLELPHYSLETPRDDARGRWSERVELGKALPHTELLRQIGQFALRAQDCRALLTGYMELTSDAKVLALVLARDPHPDHAIKTLNLRECTELSRRFAETFGYWRRPQVVSEDFRVLLGRQFGYGDAELASEQTISAALQNTNITVRYVHFFSARYGGIFYDEPAAVLAGKITALENVANLAYATGQQRFVCETRGQTLVFNAEKEE